ncbi:MAG: MBL fold metallo-hydrolase [Patescibacteria group bacterium]|nr:MBL fold metallo-hydrolase [Patescibacteria group bacterium]
MKTTFYGGTGSVTGANFLVEHADAAGTAAKILVDCGMLQGTEAAETWNREAFPYDPAKIDVLVITHAHIDHIGRIPKLVKDGFRGKIVSTPPTRDIAELLLFDTCEILENDARRKGVLPLFEKRDVEQAVSLWQTLPYHEHLALPAGITLVLKNSGHILGSAMAQLSAADVTATFTGDLGNSPSLLLADTESVAGTNYLVMESVYGDRNHESKESRQAKLKSAIMETIARKKTLIIPSFSVERTQQMLYEMSEMFASDGIDEVPVFLDSPLAIKVTKIYEKYASYLNDHVREEIAQGDRIFRFPKLKFTALAQDSARIEHTANPKIIMAGSGMSQGGRVVEHEKEHAGDTNAIILFVGYQAAGTLGRQLAEGAKTVDIDGKNIHVKAKIESIEGYSSHKDSDHLVAFVEDAAKAGKLKKVFAVMGEPKSSLFLVQRLRDELDVNAEYPEYGESVEFK